MLQKIRNMIKVCFVTTPTNDSESYPITNVGYFDKEQTAVRLSPYGLYSNPPANSTGILFCAGANEGNTYALVSSDDRIKNLAEGEVAVGNPVTGTQVKFDKDGNLIEIIQKNRTITIAEDNTITVTGDYSLNVGGKLDIIAQNDILIKSVNGKIDIDVTTPKKVALGDTHTVPTVQKLIELAGGPSVNSTAS